MRACVVALGFVIALAGCLFHGPAIPELPSKGGPAWTEVTSAHFVIWTDSSPARGRELAQIMERHRQVVLGVALGGASSANTKSFVLALRDAEEVGAYVPPEFIAYSWGGTNPVRQPIIVVAADTSDSGAEVFTHELTHVIIHSVIPWQPHWFAEGIATYFETARPSGLTGTVDVGQPIEHRVESLRRHHLVPIASLFACNLHECMDEMYYATAWAFFSFLVNEHQAQLIAYMQQLRDPSQARRDAAWADSFPGITTEQLDHELAQWLVHGKRVVLHYKLELRDVTSTARPLTDGDALAARGLLRYMFAHDTPATRADLDAAVAADRANVVAHLVLVSLTHGIGVDDARAVAAAHPGDWRAWWLVGIANQIGPEATAARAKICGPLRADAPADILRSLCAAAPAP